MEYEPVIGLEVHVQLATKTKMFCGCANLFGAPPNSLVCPVCLGLPGSLPVLNAQAVELAIRTGLALGCTIAPFTKFDRKNYFYPDLPKNYQISQYDLPICSAGRLEAEREGGGMLSVGIHRAHLEEDAGKLVHGPAGEDTRVDLNRAGVPLLEIVSDPDLRSPDEAFDYLTALKALLIYMGASECEMQKGSLRVDANVSIRPKGQEKFGTRAELKNLNSFRGVQKALAYEIRRQTEVLAGGGKVAQETRSFDLEKETTAPLRSKEEVQEYRYFPEPDLPPLKIAAERIEAARAALPEFPRARRERFQTQYGLSAYDAQLLTADRRRAEYFEACVKASTPERAKEIAHWLAGDLRDAQPAPGHVAELVALVADGAITRPAAKEAAAVMASEGRSPRAIVAERGLAQVSDAGELEGIADRVIAENPKALADYKGGKGNALAFLVGAVMKASRGKANPQKAREILERKLASN